MVAVVLFSLSIVWFCRFSLHVRCPSRAMCFFIVAVHAGTLSNGLAQFALVFWVVASTFGLADGSGSHRMAPRLRGHASFCQTGGAWIQDWADEFEGDALDQSSWQVVVSGDGERNISLPVGDLGVTACRAAKCVAENVKVSGGMLRLLSNRDASDSSKFLTGAVDTNNLRAWSAGEHPFRLCVSAQLPPISRGVWPAHWMLPQNGYSDRCLDEGEMDITEMVSGDGIVYNTYHWMASWPQKKCGKFEDYHKSAFSTRRLPDYASSFHEFAIERSADHISYAIDGQVVSTVRASQHGFTLSSSPFFVILNTAIGGGWPGAPTEDTQLPVEHLIDYVRVVRPAGGDSVSDKGAERGIQAGGGFQAAQEVRTLQGSDRREILIGKH
ncbi:unnamed protein product [Polarella glacialis]|uniref:GH16 domain-containing protein n=1 Tax=Polarella glacialis TaxID=89957 RepID=A0A813H137_POLGL|nr:unnamed protein product [Polarella glacialis]